MAKRAAIAKSDELDTLSAIWIFLNDGYKNPILTYKGIAFRLGLADDFEAKRLVLSRSELFRPGILKSRLDTWKEKMIAGKSRPSWLTEMADPGDQRESNQRPYQ